MGKRYQVIKPAHGYYKGECLDTDIAPTIDTGVGCWHTLIGESMEEIKCEQVGQIVGSGFTEMTGRIYSENGLAPSIRTFAGGNTEVKIAEPIIYDDYNGRIKADQDCIGILTTNCGNDALRNGVKIIEPVIVDEIYNNREPRVYSEHCPTIRAERQGLEVVELNYRFFEQAFETLRENDCEVGDTIDAFNKKVNKDGVSPTITTRPDGFKTAILPITTDYRIRKLTERECFRLMGVKESDYKKVAKNQSMSALYHEAGDSIVTTCLMAIFGELFRVDYQSKINELVEELKQ